MYDDLTSADLIRIAGFMGLDKRTFSERLGISFAYLSRVLNGKDPLTHNILTKTLSLLETYIENNPGDLVSCMIRDCSLKYLSQQNKLSPSLKRRINNSGYTIDDFSTLERVMHSFNKDHNESESGKKRTQSKPKSS